ncbi:hypothetical protein [Sulfodiicoccus acidiphilus]|uniref:hypothetical protein n=1 Tax=Sulfodiicoccus acidiphilus TaxID=1670455 RepID=UPI00357165B4
MSRKSSRSRSNLARCSSCGKPLRGVRDSGAKTEKRPERPFGGYLCHRCLEAAIRAGVRGV